MTVARWCRTNSSAARAERRRQAPRYSLEPVPLLPGPPVTAEGTQAGLVAVVQAQPGVVVHGADTAVVVQDPALPVAAVASEGAQSVFAVVQAPAGHLVL